MFRQLLLIASIVWVPLAALANDRPNVLFIAIDDLRPELGCYGSSQAITPNIDRLASQGLQLNRAYCQVPICMGTRASLMTSILPTLNRYRGNCQVDVDTPGVKTLPQVFREAGYTTISNGKIFHHRMDTAARSWSQEPWVPHIRHSESHDPETTQELSKTKQRGRIYEYPDMADDAYHDGLVAKQTIKDLEQLKTTGKPFFLACGFIRPHMPFYAPTRYWELYKREDIEIAGNRYRPKDAPKALQGSREYQSYHLGGYKVGSDAWHRMMRHGYLASTSYVDKLTGDVLSKLEALGLKDNTIIVIWGDHGWHLGEHDFWGKHNTMHLSTRVPLIVKVPGKPAGISESLVEVLDIFPTLCELANIKMPDTVQGKSFANLLEQPEQAFREAAYSRFNHADAIITERFSYTQFGRNGGEMLYDLKQDPEENVNLAGNKEHRKTIETMQALLQQRQAEAARVEKLIKPR